MLQPQPAPSDLYVNLVTDFRLARAIWCAAHFRLADAIGTGPTSVDDIAATTGTNAGALRRLLDALTASGLICSDSAGHYGLTPASAVLRSDHPQSQRALIDLTLGGEFYEAWGALQSTLVTGQTAFEARHGASWIDFYNAHPESGRAFAEAMTGVTRAFEAGVLQSDPFPPFRRVVDVGGSQGSLLRSLLEHTPDATGVVLDLPNVIAGWSESGVDTLGGRITGVGGNFFESVPAGEDLYLLKMILHDWDDERAVSILRTVGEAMGPSSRLAIVRGCPARFTDSPLGVDDGHQHDGPYRWPRAHRA